MDFFFTLSIAQKINICLVEFMCDTIGHRVLFVGKFLITDVISLVIAGLPWFSASSVNFKKLCFYRNFISIFIFWYKFFPQHPEMLILISEISSVMSPFYIIIMASVYFPNPSC